MSEEILLRRWVATASLPALPFAPASSAQNLAANPEFDLNVDGREEIADLSMTVDWSALDRNGSPGSGSLRGLSPDSNAANLGVDSRVDSIAEEESYQDSAYLRLPAGQSGIGDIGLAFYWNDGFACSGSELVGGFSNSVGAADQWFYVSVDPAVAPAGAKSARLAASGPAGRPEAAPQIRRHAESAPRGRYPASGVDTPSLNPSRSRN